MKMTVSTILGWFGYGGALGEHRGQQTGSPSATLVEGARSLGPDAALQLSTVWACVWLLANTIASLPLFVYSKSNGQRELARDSLLWQLLHETPNSRMTPLEFWVAMLLNLLLRGNAYARIDRNSAGDAIALWPMAADQVELKILDGGSSVYFYRLDSNVAALAAENVLHLKEIGNGTIGLSRLDYMRATTSEAAHAQTTASKIFANGGKPSGLLMLDRVLKPEQRTAIKQNFIEMAEGGTSRLFVLEADMKYQQVNLSPQDQQLLETRRFSVEEVCRWFSVPPVLVGHSNVTAWGSGIEQLIDGFYKFTVRPYLVNLEQALTKRLLTPAQRAQTSIEFNFDALLRASLKDRVEIYSKFVMNGLKTRNECRQLENDPPIAGANELTAQVNLAPLHMLGKITKPGVANAGQENTFAN
jgi:HK97 family phage portal protein